ncbi:hypothetical protein O1611_g7263 [Lasiodiplodia mahajangana]|uniref:Uncharacterized protein n=1 Tax=Lasiodiplodia mahajangana TaxID=1108764 RepID=A0ACC2JFX9_9PEZI|nr:hypothetical protein O1611_g7263 [Lasiodiplodia mahajangana]
MTTILPRASRATPTLGKLARATPKVVSGGALALRAAGAASLRTPYTKNGSARHMSSQSSPSSKLKTTQAAEPSTRGLLPEFSLKGKVVIVSGGAQGLGVVQAEALLEAGATGKYRPLIYHLLKGRGGEGRRGGAKGFRASF